MKKLFLTLLLVFTLFFTTCDLANIGCGIIKIYNAAKMIGKHTSSSDIIYEFDLNPHSKTSSALSLLGPVGAAIGLSPWNGFFGASPFGIEDYLTQHEFKPEMTWNLDEFLSWAKEDRVFIALYWHGQGAHYVMMQADMKGKYTTYNWYGDDTTPTSDIDFYKDILENGDNTFISGFYIPKMGG